MEEARKGDRNTLSDIERGKVFLSIPYALVISDALGVPLDSLYERISEGE